MSLDTARIYAQAQDLVYGSGCTLVLPGLLLTAAAAMLAYRHVTEDNFDLPLNGFLATILLQMLPLVALKAKIWSCTDRVSLVPLVLVKTLLMHSVLEVLRISSQLLEGVTHGKLSLLFDVAMLVAALAILRLAFELPFSPSMLLDHRDVRNLVLMALAGAFISEAFFVYVQPSWMSEATKVYTQDGLVASKVLFVAANYVDVVAFMPVVWRLYQAESALEDFAVGTVVSLEARQQVRLFFGFVGIFYLWDDVIDPVLSLLEEPLALMAHAAHFMLLLDFAGFFLFQVSNTGISKEKESGEQLQGLLAEGVEDDCC